MSGYSFRAVIEFCENIFTGYSRCYPFIDKRTVQIAPERFRYRKEHSSVIYGVTFHIVKITIAVWAVVIIKTVCSEKLDNRLLPYFRFRDIAEINSGRITLILDIKTKLLFLYCVAESIHVLHHQVPVALRGIIAGVLQRFHEQSLFHISAVARKLPHLIGHPSISIFISHSHNLICIDTCDETDIAQSLIDRIFGSIQQTRTLQLLIIGTTCQSGTIKYRRGLIYITGHPIGSRHCSVLGVGGIGRHHHARCTPKMRIAHPNVLAKVCQCHDIARVAGRSRLVGHPDFHTIDANSRRKIGQLPHGRGITVAKIL